MDKPYFIKSPDNQEVPIVISVPHSGTVFPKGLTPAFHSHLQQTPDDTDWFVDQLYSFAPSLGITLISAKYNRWVIDLNRDPKGKALYNDGRVITGLCPTTTFLGEPLYKKENLPEAEVARRLETYYWPYHYKIQKTLDHLKSKFGKVILWDAHSIRKSVPTIHAADFPDMILGTADGAAVNPKIANSTFAYLCKSGLLVRKDHLFKGGYITRKFGNPKEHQHAMQLEMTKINYMDNDEKVYDTKKAAKIQDVLKSTFAMLIDRLKHDHF